MKFQGDNVSFLYEIDFALVFVISGKTANGLAERSCLLCRNT